MISLLLGIPLGILSSLTAWWLLFHVFVPTVSFSSFVSKISEPDQEPLVRYRVKLRNDGRRSMLDLDVRIEARIRGINPRYPNNLTVVSVPVRGANVSTLGPKRSRIVTLLLGKLPETETQLLPRGIRQRAAAGELQLEELLCLGAEAKLRVVVFGYDSFSGTRRVFISQDYRLADIKTNRFKGLEPGDEEPAALSQLIPGGDPAEPAVPDAGSTAAPAIVIRAPRDA